ncbi:hypothetical protein [Caulobacter hibisci]|nr:hypothetical protein [Caulobacter hibisci]
MSVTPRASATWAAVTLLNADMAHQALALQVRQHAQRLTHLAS